MKTPLMRIKYAILLAIDQFCELKKGNWWRENNTSLILTPDPIIEDVDIRKIKKKSLELAGL